jgi:hypothetical protein
MRLFQRFEQEEYFGGHSVAQSRGVGKGTVAAAGDDSLEGLDEGANPGGQLRASGEFLEPGRSCSRVAGEQGLGHGEADSAFEVLILAAVASISQVASDRLPLCLHSGGGVSTIGFDIGKEVPSRPKPGFMAKLRSAFDCTEDFPTRFVQTTELSQC